MAKELPYFKFEPGAWENGNIQICSFEAQGVFINICSMYWQRLGDLPYRLALIKICRGNEAPLKSLVDNGMIKVSDESISIDFLDAQLQEFSEVREKRVSAGRQGGKNRSLRPEIERIAGSQFYVIYCYKADESFIKFGITSDSISRRFSGKMPYDYEVIFQYSCDDPLSIETECCDRLRQHRYTPAVEFQGYLECYRLSVFDELNDILRHRTSNALAMVKHRTAIRREEKREEEKKKEEKMPPAGSGVELPFDLKSPLGIAWLEWEKFRTEKRQKLVPSTIKKQLKFLGGRPDSESIAIIDQSITQGWTGLFELKNNVQRNGKPNKSSARGADAIIKQQDYGEL